MSIDLWQAGFSVHGVPVTSKAEATAAIREINPDAYDAEDEDAENGIWLVQLPLEVVDILVEHGVWEETTKSGVTITVEADIDHLDHLD